MGTEGKRWKWSEAAKQNARQAERPWLNGNTHTTRHGLAGTLAYNSWKKMMHRCYVETDKHFVDYGGRGIKVCQQWHDPVGFVADMGQRQPGFSLERIDVNGDYEPRNCCWLPHKFQGKNRRPWKHTPEGLERIRAARRKRSNPCP